MKHVTYLLATVVSILFIAGTARAQGISYNTTGAASDPSAILDVASTTKGLLAPRMTAAQKTAIASPATGLLIYQTNGTPGFYYYDGAAWTAVSGGGGAGWGLTGNAGTTPATNFVGTTDNVALRFKVNNTWAGELHPTSANTSYGLGAGQAMTTGNTSTAIGRSSLAANTTGARNTAIGYQSLQSNTTGIGNTAVGYQSINRNTTGGNNTATGFNSLKDNTASENTAYGASSLAANTTGTRNVATGYSSLAANTTGDDNTASGYSSLQSNTTGSFNTASGTSSLQSNTTGVQNTVSGYGSLFSNTTGSGNTASGYNSLFSNSTGAWNTASGSSSLHGNTTGVQNTAYGHSSLHNNSTGGENTADGYSSLVNNTTGGQNAANGSHSLRTNTTGSNNTAIGYLADVSTGALTNATAIGNGATVNASNKVRLGNSSVTVIEGQVAFTFPSDGRFKTNVKENVPGLDFIMKLRPVTYNFETRKYDRHIGKADSMIQKDAANYAVAEGVVHTGFIAQEVEKTARETGFDFDAVHVPTNDKDNYGLAYSEFTVPLVKAVQEQQKTITDLQKQVAELMQRMQAMENKK